MNRLLVDDHEGAWSALRSLLAATLPYAVVIGGTNGEDAVDAAAAMHSEGMLMDLGLPRMDGLKATRLILHRHPSTRLVNLSIDTPAPGGAEWTDARSFRDGRPTRLSVILSERRSSGASRRIPREHRSRGWETSHGPSGDGSTRRPPRTALSSLTMTEQGRVIGSGSGLHRQQTAAAGASAFLATPALGGKLVAAVASLVAREPAANRGTRPRGSE